MIRKYFGIFHEGIRTKNSTNPLYDILFKYLTYSLKLSMQKRPVNETPKIKDDVKRLEISLKDQYFDGNDPMKV